MKKEAKNLTEITDKKSSAGWISGSVAFASWLLGTVAIPFAGMVAPIWLSFVLGAAFFTSLIGGSAYWATDGLKGIKESYKTWKSNKNSKKQKDILKDIQYLEQRQEESLTNGRDVPKVEQKEYETLIQRLIRIKEAEKKNLAHINTDTDVTEGVTIDDERTV